MTRSSQVYVQHAQRPDAASLPVLPWTGERFIPSQGGPEIYYEHAHRYLLARELLAGKVVVDLASGEGYGAAWLAEVAESVVGVDLDDASVRHARSRYARHANLTFAVGDIQVLPLSARSADAVTCFEAIEHVQNPRAVVEEVVRILRPGGLLLVSTPNKVVYADERDFNNEFHIHEFYLPDLELLLGEYFAERDLVGQRVVGGSLTWRLGSETEAAGGDGAGFLVAPGFSDTGTGEPASMVEPMYVMAACRLEGPPRVVAGLPSSSVLVDGEELLLEDYRSGGKRAEELTGHIRDRDSQLERARAQLAAYEEQARLLSQRFQERDAHDGTRPSVAGRSNPDAGVLETALFSQQQLAARLSRDLDAATELNLRLLAELRLQHHVLADMQLGITVADGLLGRVPPRLARLTSRLPQHPWLRAAVRRTRRMVRRS